MIQFRKHLRQLAAFVLLVWAFAAGSAIAHACEQHVQVELGDCCAIIEAATLRSDTAFEAAGATVEAVPWLPTAGPTRPLVVSTREHAGLLAPRVWADSGQRLHVTLLRLAL
jgi:hypothetical protein